MDIVTLALAKKYADSIGTGTIETFTIATSDWTSMSGETGDYDYSTEVTLSTTIGANTIIELINDNAVAFSTHGFAIGDIGGQGVKLWSLGLPSSSVTLKFLIRG